MFLLEIMRITFFTILCGVHIYIHQCMGIKFIDLPGFGSEENKPDPFELMKASDAEKVKEIAPDQVIVVPKPKSVKFEDIRRRLNYEADVKIQNEPQDPVTSKVKYESYQIRSDSESNTEIQNLDPNLHSRNRRLLPAKNGRTSVTTNPDYKTIMRRVDIDLDENLKHKIATLVEQTMHDTDIKVKNIIKAKERHCDKPAYKIGFILSMVKKTRDVLNELFNVAVKHRDDWKALEQLKVFELIVHTNVDTTNLVRQLVEIHIQNLNTSSAPEKHGKRRVVVLK